MAGGAVRCLIASAALLLLLNFFYSRSNTYVHRPEPAAANSGVLELHGNAASARRRRIEELEKELSALREPKPADAAAAAIVSGSATPLARQPQQQQTPAASAPASQLLEVHMPPPPPPTASVVREVVPLAERVTVPPGDYLPDELRAMRKGTDLFISFASANMAPFALNWVANLRRAGIGLSTSTSTQVLIGALDDKMENICKEQQIYVLSIVANLPGVNLRFDYGAYKRMAALKVAFYTRILTMGFNVWACDADTGWMGNPSAFVNEYPMQHVDVLTTTDCIDVEGDERGGCWHVDHNTGLVYMRSRPIVIEFTLAWKAKIQNMCVRRRRSPPRRRAACAPVAPFAPFALVACLSDDACPRARLPGATSWCVTRRRSTCSCARASARARGIRHPMPRAAPPSVLSTRRGMTS